MSEKLKKDGKTKITLEEWCEENGKEYLSEWDFEKNVNLNPNMISPFSNKNAYWICKLGHHYPMIISNKTGKGYGCPICNNKMLLKGFNDLETKKPDLAKQWHPTKNGHKKPSDVLFGSTDCAWWLCEKGHDWNVRIESRYHKDSGCPYCSGRKIWKGFNDLESQYPEIAKQWHPTKNKDKRPDNVTKMSSYKAWWICDLGHEYQSEVYNKTLEGYGCPYCNNKKVLSGFNDLKTRFPEIAKQWHPTKNGNKKPENTMPGNAKKVWWICDRGHSYPATPRDRTASSHPSGCPYCTGKKVLKGFNDLDSQRPDIAKQWHPTKNGKLKPTQVTVGSNLDVWWICENGHEWHGQINGRTRSDGACPVCNNRRLEQGFNDLQTFFDGPGSSIKSEWCVLENNILKLIPRNLSLVSDKKAWWECQQCGNKYLMSIRAKIEFHERNIISCTECKGIKNNTNHYI